MGFCANCGKQLPDGANTCYNCGNTAGNTGNVNNAPQANLNAGALLQSVEQLRISQMQMAQIVDNKLNAIAKKNRKSVVALAIVSGVLLVTNIILAVAVFFAYTDVFNDTKEAISDVSEFASEFADLDYDNFREFIEDPDSFETVY